MDSGGGEGGPNSPFFLVAGMFGNVLNLPTSRESCRGPIGPFYGLQARGLYGNETPHGTFEEMATCLSRRDSFRAAPMVPTTSAASRAAGITAFEMAHQLQAAGEEVGLLLLLDSPLPVRPPLTRMDRIRIQIQRVRQRGDSTIWSSGRASGLAGRWSSCSYVSMASRQSSAAKTSSTTSRSRKRSERRCRSTRCVISPGLSCLFRPKLDRAYVLGPDRVCLDSAKEWIYHDNGYTDWVDSIEVCEMPGDHDSMVLEPNVRVMASMLRDRLKQTLDGEARADSSTEDSESR